MEVRRAQRPTEVLLYTNPTPSGTGRGHRTGENWLDSRPWFLYPLTTAMFAPTSKGPAAAGLDPPSGTMPRKPSPARRPASTNTDPADAEARTHARQPSRRDRPDRQGTRGAPEPPGGGRASDRAGQTEAGAGGLVPGAGRRGHRQGAGDQRGPAPGRDLEADLPRADERLACAPAHAPGRLPGPEIQLQSPRLGRQVWRGRRACPGRFDRGGLRGGEPASRPVRDRPAGELDRRPDRRHAGDVRQAPGREDPRRGPAADPPLPAGPLRLGAGAAGLFQGAGAVAVPELDQQEPAPGEGGRRGVRPPRRPSTPPARSSPPPSPAAPRATPST